MNHTPTVPEPDKLDGAAIFDEVESVFRKYTVQPTDHAYVALVVYAAYTHAMDCFDYAPRLTLTSAEKRSGKTRTMEIMALLVRNPLQTANASTAAIFRSIGGGDPVTVLFDEADTVFGTSRIAEQNEDLRALLNAGFQQGAPVLRTVGPQHEPKEFPVFAPAVLAGIGNLPDTVTDRAVNLRLRRRRGDEKVHPYRTRRDRPGITEVRERLAAWVQTVREALVDADPDTPLEDRAADVWEPLLAVADSAGGQWPARIRAAAEYLVKKSAEDDRDNSEGLELLSDIRDALTFMNRKSGHMQSAVLVEHLKAKEDSLWRQIELTQRGLSDRLRPYGIRSKPGGVGKGKRGYLVAELEDVFARYLPPLSGGEASKPSQSVPTASDQGKHGDASQKTNRPPKRPDDPRDTGDALGDTSENTKRPHVSAGETTKGRFGTVSTDHPQDMLSTEGLDTAEDTPCDVCGRPVRGRYAALNGPTHPGCRQQARDGVAGGASLPSQDDPFDRARTVDLYGAHPTHDDFAATSPFSGGAA